MDGAQPCPTRMPSRLLPLLPESLPSPCAAPFGPGPTTPPSGSVVLQAKPLLTPQPPGQWGFGNPHCIGRAETCLAGTTVPRNPTASTGLQEGWGRRQVEDGGGGVSRAGGR